MHGRIGVIIPTFHRNEALTRTLDALGRQTILPTQVVVVDNAAATECETICELAAETLPYNLTYLSSPTNGGPAGATKLGMEFLAERFADSDWIVRADDDSPEVEVDLFYHLLKAATEANRHWKSVGGVGRNGAVFDFRTAQLTKPPRDDSGFALVDYLATNYFPFYAVQAVRCVGPFREDLFFGHDEVEYGLRLRRAGFTLVRWEPPGAARTPTRRSLSLGTASWRRYYSIRNQIVIAQDYCSRLVALRVASIALIKPLLNLFIVPSRAIGHLRLASQAIIDAYRGNLGRTVEPTFARGRLDDRA